MKKHNKIRRLIVSVKFWIVKGLLSDWDVDMKLRHLLGEAMSEVMGEMEDEEPTSFFPSEYEHWVELL